MQQTPSVIDEAKRSHGCDKQFLTWIKTWLKWQGYQSIHTESLLNAIQFYEQMGYTVMPFDDSDGYEGDARDTSMGKLL